VIVWHQDRFVRMSKDLERVLDAGFTEQASQGERLSAVEDLVTLPLVPTQRGPLL
jgi:hypothetical protein